MTIEEVRNAMMEELDFYAHEYANYNDDAPEIALRFRHLAHANNKTLRVLSKNGEYAKFTKDVIEYTKQRNKERWEIG